MKLSIVEILICAMLIPAFIGIASAATPAIDVKLEVSFDYGENWYHSTDPVIAPLAMPGNEIWWQSTITNIGDVELTDVEVINSYGAGAFLGTLAPGESEWTGFHIPFEKGLVSNTETATGYYGDTVVTDSDTAYYRGYNAMPSTTLFADNTLIEDPMTDSRWYTDDVLVELVAHDADDPDSALITNYALDGVGKQYTGPFTVSGDGVHTLEFHSADPLGNAGTPIQWACKIDTTHPYVASTYPADDATDVPVDATITGIWSEPTQTTFIPVVMVTVDGTALYDMSCTYSAESFAIQPHSALPAGKVVTVSIFGAVDVAGNKQTDPYTWSFTTAGASDITPPSITISSPLDNAVYTLGQPVLASWSVTDDASGVASSTSTVPSGEAIDTSTVGEKTFTVTATDNAGNAVTETVTYNVVYACTPLTPSCTKVTQVKLGSGMPVKLVLKDYDGSLITDAVVELYLAKQSGSGWGDEIAATSISAPKDSNVFRYNPAAGQYMYNLNTKVLSTGTWQLRVKVNDGTTHVMTITIK